MRVIIATAGPPITIADTLISISRCVRPGTFQGVTVVENGKKCGVDRICQRIAKEHQIEIESLHCPAAGKSNALNFALSRVPEKSLVILTDDDVSVCPEWLTCYQKAAEEAADRTFFGGPFRVAQQTPPPQWLVPYLPGSAKGWDPDPARFDCRRDLFVGFNWAAWAGDIKRIGGADPRFGAGSIIGANGQETQMQMQFFEAGFRSHLVTSAYVTHLVPESHCSPEFALQRIESVGVFNGIRRSTAANKPTKISTHIKRWRERFLRMQCRRHKDYQSDLQDFLVHARHRRIRGFLRGQTHPDSARIQGPFLTATEKETSANLLNTSVQKPENTSCLPAF